jgi:Ser/Thr protein kinase RdoA (MazF antagonist)
MRASQIASWSGLELLEPLTGGARSTVFLARRGSTEYVVRASARTAEAIDWELDLQHHLDRHRIRVPRPVPADDGRHHVDGVMVQERLGGHPPRHVDDWARVVTVLRAVHEATMGWPQRPGFASSRDLQMGTRGGDVDFSAMPTEAVQLVRRSWRPVDHGPVSAIHGDVGAGNVLIDDSTVGLIDWDESRVDLPWFDLAHLPPEVPVPVPPAPAPREQLITAGVAWVLEPDYAAVRLGELRRRNLDQ